MVDISSKNLSFCTFSSSLAFSSLRTDSLIRSTSIFFVSSCCLLSFSNEACTSRWAFSIFVAFRFREGFLLNGVAVVLVLAEVVVAVVVIEVVVVMADSMLLLVVATMAVTVATLTVVGVGLGAEVLIEVPGVEMVECGVLISSELSPGPLTTSESVSSVSGLEGSSL